MEAVPVFMVALRAKMSQGGAAHVRRPTMRATVTQEQVLASYPQLTPEGLRAVFAYAAEVTQDQALHVVRRGVA
jgi:hypothetical protein